MAIRQKTEKTTLTKKSAKDKVLVTEKIRKPRVRKINTSPIKPIAKKTPTARRSAKKTAAKVDSELANDNTEPTPEIKLPKGAPLRLIRKVAILNSLFNPKVEKLVYRISYVASMCFFLIGSALIISNYLSENLNFKTQRAEIVGSTESTISTATNLTPVVKTDFSLISTIPDNVIEDTKVTFTVTNALEVVTKITPVGATGFISINTENLSDGKYRTTIPFKQLANGYYKLLVLVKPLDGSQAVSFASKAFFIGSQDTEDIYNHLTKPNPDPIATSTSNESTETAETETKTTTTTSTTASETTATPVKTTVSETEPIIKDPITQTEASPDPAKTEAETTKSVVLETIKSPETAGTFRITSNQKSFTGPAIIDVATDSRFAFIELYARPLQSRTTRFVTLATKRNDIWRFIFDSKNIPNGDYEFFAKSTLDGKAVQSESLAISINNEVVVIASTDKTLDPVKVAEIDDSTREFTPTTPVAKTSSSSISSAVEEKTALLLRDNSSELSELMQRYSVAIQTSDETLIESVNKSIEKLRSEIVTESLKNNDTRYISDDIDAELAKNIADLQERANVFEEVRRQRSDGNTAIDTDSDGISDIDEVKIYKTNPELADTDGDGVNDGIEIMGGYNPLDTKVESLISFQSPKESIALVRDDVLKIEKVTSVIPIEQPDKKTGSIEIRGSSIPNSFVTLYIFSSPTVVTVSTDADGFFVYTLDKELADGQHDIYVTLTDNAGDIVAQSSAFSFIKDALAITPVNAAEGEVAEPVVITESSNKMYRVVVGVGILAFGLILLMLGITLRPKEEVIQVS